MISYLLIVTYQHYIHVVFQKVFTKINNLFFPDRTGSRPKPAGGVSKWMNHAGEVDALARRTNLFRHESNLIQGESNLFQDQTSKQRDGTSMFQDQTSKQRGATCMFQDQTSKQRLFASMFGDGTSKQSDGTSMLWDETGMFKGRAYIYVVESGPVAGNAM